MNFCIVIRIQTRAIFINEWQGPGLDTACPSKRNNLRRHESRIVASRSPNFYQQHEFSVLSDVSVTLKFVRHINRLVRWRFAGHRTRAFGIREIRLTQLPSLLYPVSPSPLIYRNRRRPSSHTHWLAELVASKRLPNNVPLHNRHLTVVSVADM